MLIEQEPRYLGQVRLFFSPKELLLALRQKKISFQALSS